MKGNIILHLHYTHFTAFVNILHIAFYDSFVNYAQRYGNITDLHT